MAELPGEQRPSGAGVEIKGLKNSVASADVDQSTLTSAVPLNKYECRLYATVSVVL